MTGEAPLVSVVVPAWNEEADIAGCIDAIGAQAHPAGRTQLVLVDAGSTDRTIEAALAAATPYGFAEVAVVPSPARRTSVGLNAGLERAKGEYLVRIDARSRVEAEYVSTCVGLLAARPGVGVVGGAQVAQARGPDPLSLGIARALRNPWATGLSRYRRSSTSGPSDTVWMGVFRTAELRHLGGWSEEVALNEDFELNQRYRRAGMTVWFEASLQSRYLPRATLGRLSCQYFYFGRVKGTWWARGDRPTPRQVGLLGLPVVGFVGLVVARHRFGPLALAAVPASLLAVDAAAGGPVGAGSRVASAAAIGVVAGSWWAGVVVGAAGEALGVSHQHA